MGLTQTERLNLAYYEEGDLNWAAAFNQGQEDADDRLFHTSSAKEYGAVKTGSAWTEEPYAKITSNGHGLSDEMVVECEDFAGGTWNTLNGTEHVITVVDVNNFRLNDVDSSALGTATAGNVKQVKDKWSSYGATKAGTVWTEANPAVITSAAHGLVTGDVVRCTNFAGGTWGYELNGTLQTITKLTDNTFQLNGVNSSAFGTATSGDVKKYTRVEDPNDWDGIGTAIIGHYVGQRFYSEYYNYWWSCTVPGDGATAVWVKDTELPVDPENVDDQSASDAEFQNTKLPSTASKPTSLKQELEVLRYALKRQAVGVAPNTAYWYDKPSRWLNLLPSGHLGHPHTPATDPPDGYTVLGAPTLSRVAAPLSLGGNGYVLGILGTGTDDGIRRTLYGLKPNTYYLFMFTGWSSTGAGQVAAKFAGFSGETQISTANLTPIVMAKLLKTPDPLPGPPTIDIFQPSAYTSLVYATFAGLYECGDNELGRCGTIISSDITAADVVNAITVSVWANQLETEIMVPGPGYMIEVHGTIAGRRLGVAFSDNLNMWARLLEKVGAGAYVDLGERGQWATEVSGDYTASTIHFHHFVFDPTPNTVYSYKIEAKVEDATAGHHMNRNKGSRLDVIVRPR